MMGWPRWQPGRQGGGYRKMRLVQGRWWDCYLIDYPVGSRVSRHRDCVPGRSHWRLNIVVLGQCDVTVYHPYEPGRDGIFYASPDPPRRWLGGRVVLFRPDVNVHEVRPVERRRVVLSFGWARR